MNLSTLFRSRGSDKDHPQGHSYAPIYEQYLAERRQRIRDVLELGVLGGASLHAWREYFPKARIVGLDVECEPLEASRMRIVKCNATIKEELDVALGVQAFDVIVDDASHWECDQLKSFELLAGRLKAGGLYFIEDVQCLETHDKLRALGFEVHDRRTEMNRYRFDDVIAVYQHPVV